jgi:S-methylmethionine-dependent homocysteine/selenocysteine methylase
MAPPRALLLDGGTGHVLKTRCAVDPDSPGGQTFTGGALANRTHPTVVQRLHEDYLLAGADVVTTNTFAVTPWHLARVLAAHDADASLDALAEAAGRNARAAVDAHPGSSLLVAGCLPPLRDCYASTDWLAADHLGAVGDEARRTYSRLVHALSPFVDIWLVETASWVSQALVPCHVATTAGGQKPLWVSWTLRDDARPSRPPLLRSGEAMLPACDAILASGTPVHGWLVNCTCAPAAASPATLAALRSAAAASGASVIGCSPNGFQQTTSQWLASAAPEPESGWAPASEFDAHGAWRPASFAAWGAALAEREGGLPGGPRLALGGCCGIGPPHIAALQGALTSARR